MYSLRQNYELIKQLVNDRPELVGEALYIIRDHSGDTLEDAAQKCHISKETMKAVEQGQAPRETIHKVLAGYELPSIMSAVSQANALLEAYGIGIKLVNTKPIAKLETLSGLPHVNILDSIGHIIRTIRVHKGLSQVKLAEALGKCQGVEGEATQGYISKVETGSCNVSPTRIRQFAECLGCPDDQDYLVWLTEQYRKIPMHSSINR